MFDIGLIVFGLVGLLILFTILFAGPRVILNLILGVLK